MAFKDLGPNVSQKPQAISPGGGQFTAEDHSWESLIIQQDKPVTDWEMNLMQEVLGSYGLRALFQKFLPSSFLTNAFLDRSDVLSGYVFLTPDPPTASTANTFWMKAADLVVNGWSVRFDLTQSATPGFNIITVPPPPASGTRTDLIILEVWRASVSPLPDTTNKSPAGQLLRYGNAKSPDSTPANENLADDLLDPTFLQETSRRVQVQYRYRVITGVDIQTYPDGFEDPGVFAFTTPYLGGSLVDGQITAYNYVKSSFDPGLWIAGENNPTGVTNLGTVDGQMYAIPLCAITRRNTTPFDRTTNVNGGATMTASLTDRPDGLFCDQIAQDDVLDLRRGVAWDFTELLDKSFQEVLDNSLSTRTEVFNGCSGTALFVAESLAPSTPMGQPDGARSSFGARQYTESVVTKVTVGGATSSVSVDLQNFQTPWMASPIDMTLIAPVGVAITQVTRVRVYDGSSTDYDALQGGPSFVTAMVLSATGSFIDTVNITFSAPISSVTVLVELLLTYPATGTQRNVVQDYAFWTPPAANIAAWVDSSTLSSTGDVTRKSLDPEFWQVDPGHRELTVRLRTTSQNWTAVSNGTAVVYVPDILDPDFTPSASGGYSVVNFTNWTTFTAVTLNGTPALGTPVTITYYARRPLPPLQASPGDSYQLFYQSRAIQSCPVPSGTQTLNLVPRSVGKSVHSILTGAGSPDDGFPYVSPGMQIPNGLLPAVGSPEKAMDAPSTLSAAGMTVNTGYIALPALVPYSPNSAQVTLYSGGADITVDGEGRNFWPKSDSGSVPVYSPTVFAQPLANQVKHKVAIPVIMEVKQDFPSSPPFQFRKGSLVLVVFTRYLALSSQNTIELQSSLSDSCAAVYRIRGNMMNPRRTG